MVFAMDVESTLYFYLLIECIIGRLIGGCWRQHQMEMLVGVLQHGHRHTRRHDDTLSLQSSGWVGNQVSLEGRVTPCFGDDLAEQGVVVGFWHVRSFRLSRMTRTLWRD
jgi:hypothetical protein